MSLGGQDREQAARIAHRRAWVRRPALGCGVRAIPLLWLHAAALVATFRYITGKQLDLWHVPVRGPRGPAILNQSPYAEIAGVRQPEDP